MNGTINNECATETYEMAKSVLLKEQEVSISLLQRHMKIGYTLALGLMSQLEENGVVTEQNSTGSRTLTEKYSINKVGFKEWGLGYSGCDGGDIGTPQMKSKWICGIEWGGGHDPQSLVRYMQEDVSAPPRGYESWEENISYIFNWQVMKLLSAIEGGKVENYKSFAKDAKPFVEGSNGYFKMNLYPIAFKDTNPENWASEFCTITGFASKGEYLQWCKNKRLPKIRSWTSSFTPELVICLGKTYLEDFSKAFFDNGKTLNKEIIENREISWGVNSTGTLVVILPFMVNRHGLVNNSTIQLVGERISQLLSCAHQ